MRSWSAGSAVLLLAACSGDPPLQQPWTFDVTDPAGKPLAALTLRFTEEPATSCLGGDWQRVEVIRFESLGEPAFPGRDALSWRVEEKELTIGRNEICDAYLLMGGQLQSAGFSGEYYSFGKGGKVVLGQVQGRPLAGLE